MWSLYLKKEADSQSDEETLGNNLFSYTGEQLEPMKFSNGKTQQDVVEEILKSIKEGNKIIFLKGVCGSGKSAIALNLAKHFKKTAIVVPIKTLQEQYEQDYTKDKFILKDDKNPLNISIIKGRNNFMSCFDSNLRADSPELPCTIELREKNSETIRRYLKMNPDVKEEDFSSVSDVRRMSIAPICPHWNPILPAEVSAKPLEKAKKKKYMSCSGKEYAYFIRNRGCKYYDQFEAYIDADVLVFNSQKYLIETAMGRKPKTDLEIIDECDEFLDSLSNERTISLNRFLNSLTGLFPETSEEKVTIKNIIKKVNDLLYEETEFPREEIKLLTEEISELIQTVIDNPYLAEKEEDNYYNTVLEVFKSFDDMLDETYFLLSQSDRQNKSFGNNQQSFDGNVYLSLVSLSIAKKFKELQDSAEVMVLMSGTLHSERVLKDIFGLEDFKVIEAETLSPGTISKYRTGLEKNCKYANFQNNSVTRKDYLKALETGLLNARHPTLVHITSFKDLPTDLEKIQYNLKETISKEKLLALQENNGHKREIEKFKLGEKSILFTTKCARGVDFPGEQCNSIIITRYPYPNISSLFWKILREQQPDKFQEFYMDKAKRELLQKIYRGLRFSTDHVILLSPDVRVLDGNLDN